MSPLKWPGVAIDLTLSNCPTPEGSFIDYVIGLLKAGTRGTGSGSPQSLGGTGKRESLLFSQVGQRV